jgi:hypothetical protein
MKQGPPDLIAIDHDDHYASHVGRTPDGRQFFITTPFIPATSDAGREFIAVYLFDKEGKLIEARIDDLGPRAALDQEHEQQLLARRLSELGAVQLGRIEVGPFEVERFGTTFGLVLQPPENESDEDDGWWVEVQPGNYMAFHEPWDSGEYDT